MTSNTEQKFNDFLGDMGYSCWWVFDVRNGETRFYLQKDTNEKMAYMSLTFREFMTSVATLSYDNNKTYEYQVLLKDVEDQDE